jgi:hypothetical protein
MMSDQAVGRRILSEEELAAENIYVKKMEKEKLDKLKHKEEAGGNSSVRQPMWAPASVKSKESSANK